MQVHISPGFSFLVEGEKHYLSEILIAAKQISINEAEWIIGGAKQLAGPYCGNQKIIAKHERFLEFRAEKLAI